MAEELRRMVERVDWMAPAHYEILSFFDNHDIIINPSSLALNIDYDSAQYLSDSCNELADAGLLVKHPGPKFELSDRGRAFLAGDVDPDELPDPTGE